MAGTQVFAKAALAIAVASLLGVALLFQTPGTGRDATLLVACLLAGTVAAAAALLASRGRSPGWVRRTAAGVLLAFAGLLAWAAFIVTHVPLS